MVMHAHEMIELSELYGAENVEAAAIALTTFKDSKGLHVLIEPTKAKLQLILEAVYGVAIKSIEHPPGGIERAAAFAGNAVELEARNRELERRIDDLVTLKRVGENKYLIWSFEHGGWWRPGRVGYTTNRAEAGSYGHDQAVAILQQANIITINEALVPITHAMGEEIIAGGKRGVPE